MRKLPILLILLSLLGCDSNTGPEPEPDPYPLYWAIEEGGVLRGIADRQDAWCSCGNTTFKASWVLPREHYLRSCHVEYHRDSGTMGRYDWTLGFRPGVSQIKGRIAPEGGDYAWLATGLGDLEFDRHLAPLNEAPIPVDPRSPLSFELLGGAWSEADRPDSLDVFILKIGDPREVNSPVEARLHHEGQLDGGGFPVEGFHLVAGDETLHFKLFADDFPRPWATLAWGTALQYLGGEPLNIEQFLPEYPYPDGYYNEAVEFDGPMGTVSAHASFPEGEGPFPALLLLSGDGDVLRHQGVLLNYLGHHLARAGYATLLYDKPGTGESEGDLLELGIAERQATVEAAWNWLGADERIDVDRRVLLGYGEGGALVLEGAGRLGAAAVAALSPWLNRPGELEPIPEAVDGRFTLLDLECFGGKHLDRASFDPAVYLPALDVPVLLMAAELDPRNPALDVHTQIDLLLMGSGVLDFQEYSGMSASYNNTAPDLPPDAQVVQDLLDWMAERLP